MSERIEPQPQRHRGSDADVDELTNPPVRPSGDEGGEDDAGPRPPRPSQAEGERDVDEDENP